MIATGFWLDNAACADTPSPLFHAESAQGQQRAIATYCVGCPVRAECLADALATPPHQDQGVRGGLTARERRALRQRTDISPGRDAVTIAALRRFLDEEHHDNPPAAPRPPRKPRKEPTMPEPVEQPTITVEPEPLGQVLDLLAWAERHNDPALRKLAQTAATALAVIRQRHAADAELATLENEAAQLRERLAALDARAKELRPAAAKAKPQRDYTPSVVRAWAREQGLQVPDAGVLPQTIVQAWRDRGAA
ncbi:hypothetical protein ABH931_006100 [Streptacidiphilus sp. MAP12-33]|uniref:WhiB family transcriptional regulator n=1 Tax=Streptacidiphilus sp. MAP12-33 TaxID=3156266 RepID=UPI00351327E7